MLRFEKSLDDAPHISNDSEMSYTMLDQSNIPALISQGLLPDSPAQSVAKKIMNGRYISKRQQKVNDFKAQLNKGDKCIVGVLGDEVVGWVWIYGQNEKYEPAIEEIVRAYPQSSIIYRWLVYPPYRNRGFGTQLLDRALRVLNEQNHKKAIVMVEKDNQPSLKATRKLGFEETESIKRVRIFGYSRLSIDQLYPPQD
jgi:ribosomal protein S18 acetylase RimI-like enzyme